MPSTPSHGFARGAALAVVVALGVASPRTGVAQVRRGADAPGAEAVAPAPVDPADAARERARPHFARGLDLVARQAWSEALDAFLLARREYDSPIVLFDIAYCQRALGQGVAALATLREFLARELSGVAATRRDEAEGYVRELAARVARVVVSAPPVPAPEVLLDGRALALDARGGASAAVDPGHHVVYARAEGHAPFFADRDVAPGEEARVQVALRPLPARLVLRSNVSGARVWLDGVFLGTAPLDTAVAPGARRIEVAAAGYVRQRNVVQLASGNTARLSVDLTREARNLARQGWFWTLVGAGAAVVGTGVGVGTWLATRPAPEMMRGNLGIFIQVP